VSIAPFSFVGTAIGCEFARMLRNLAGEDARTYRHWAAFLMTLGPGSAMGFYVAMVGFYVANFESRAFFIAMALCAYLPGPLIVLLQEFLDSNLDKQYSLSVTYCFRVVLLQFVLAIATLIWLLAPQSPLSVLAAGVIIGTLAQGIFSSASQMVAAMDSGATSYCMLGVLIGGALPVAAFYVVGFGPSSSLVLFRLVLLLIPFVCVATGLVLAYLHFYTDLFQQAYERLGYDLGLGGSAGLPMTPQRKDTDPLLLTPDDKVPTWVWLWCAYTGVTTAMTVSVMCLVAFIGKPAMMQWLSLMKLSMDLVGGIASLPLSRIAYFETGPWHKSLATVAVARLYLFLSLMYVLLGIYSPYKNWYKVLITWTLFHFLHALSSPHIGVTVGSFVLIQDRKRVLRMNTLCRYGGAVTGVLAAATFLVPALGLGVNWPPMDIVVPSSGVRSP